MTCSKLKENERFFLGRSMLPTIETGAKLSFEKVPPAAIHIGDIILFDRHGSVICHRVVGKYFLKGEHYFLERGDNSSHRGVSILNSRQILGKVVAIETAGKVLLPKQHFQLSCYAHGRLVVLSFIVKFLHKTKLMFFNQRRPDIYLRARRLCFICLDYLS